MLHILHGPNILGRDEEIARLKAQVGDADIAMLNTTQLDSAALVRDIQAACDAMPFIASRRLVIVRNWLSRAGQPKRKGGKAPADDPQKLMAAYVEQLPDFCALVFADDATLSPAHPVMQAAERLVKDKRARVKQFDVPGDVVGWISERSRAKGGGISREAALLLSSKINRGNKNDRDHFDEDSRLYMLKLDTELDKLVAYAHGRDVTPADVEALVLDEEQSDIFKFIDAISARDGASAYAVMRGILARGEVPLIVMTHIARQTRLLIQAKENRGLTADAFAQVIGAHPFVARKALQQAERFSIDELERAHLRVVQADVAIKTGQMDDLTALDVLVAEFCR